ncbi:MAG: DUF6059 family protein [Spirillospora sp.]
MRVWRWLRHLTPQWEDRLGSLAYCGYWMLYVEFPPRDPPDESELPPGHPERLPECRALTPAERELWAELDGIG